MIALMIKLIDSAAANDAGDCSDSDDACHGAAGDGDATGGPTFVNNKVKR